MEFVNLEDIGVREAMLDEVDQEIAADTLYRSPRLSPVGGDAYPDLLRAAVETGNDATLQVELEAPGVLEAEESYVRSGVRRMRKVNPGAAAKTLSEGEFNRFYIRGLCMAASDKGEKYVEVYRARESGYVRPESEALIGKLLDPGDLLEDLRDHTGEDPTLLPYVNSGLSVRRIDDARGERDSS